MNTEEMHEDRAHSLLAAAFPDEFPVVNLVPAAVDGFRRHRRRTRVLGTVGGALALTGVVAAGAVGTSVGGQSATRSAASGGQGGGGDKCQVPADVIEQAGWGTAMVQKVTENCETNVALIEQAVPGARVTPHTYDPRDLPRLKSTAATPAPKSLRYYPVVAYDITVNGRTAVLSLNAIKTGTDVACGNFCVTPTTLFGGMRADEYSGPDGSASKTRIDIVTAFPESREALDASVSYPPGEERVFDFHAFSHSAEFTKLVTGSMDLLLGPKFPGGGYLSVG